MPCRRCRRLYYQVRHRDATMPHVDELLIEGMLNTTITEGRLICPMGAMHTFEHRISIDSVVAIPVSDQVPAKEITDVILVQILSAPKWGGGSHKRYMYRDCSLVGVTKDKAALEYCTYQGSCKTIRTVIKKNQVHL